jgi:hypothetical protein
MSRVYCNQCTKENLHRIEQNRVLSKRDSNHQVQNKPSDTTVIDIYSIKWLCLDCGHIFEQVPMSQLDKYKANKSLFDIVTVKEI